MSAGRQEVQLSPAMRNFALVLGLLMACGSGPQVVRNGEGIAAVAPVSSIRLRLVTFNVQDLFVADRRTERLRAIGRELGPLKPDYIGLQEAFSPANRREFVNELNRTSGLEYESLYFPSGVMGSGLFVVTRHTIEHAYFWRYSNNGQWHQFSHGDWYAGKGAAMVRLRVERDGERPAHFDIFNTHAIANYITAPYREERTDQMRELALFVGKNATAPAPAFVLGDLNCRHRHPEWKVATDGTAPGTDPLVDLIQTIAPEENGRIDHILVRNHKGFRVTARQFRQLYDGRDEAGEKIDLSDHPGYVLDVLIEPATELLSPATAADRP